MKKTNKIVPDEQKLMALEIHLKSKSLPSIEQIRNDYSYLIHHTLMLSIKNEESIIEIINQVLFVQLHENMNEIDNMESLESILFAEIVYISGGYCLEGKFKRLGSQIKDLKEVYALIEKIPEKCRKVIKLRFQHKKIEEIGKELGLDSAEVTLLSTEAVNLLTNEPTSFGIQVLLQSYLNLCPLN